MEFKIEPAGISIHKFNDEGSVGIRYSCFICSREIPPDEQAISNSGIIYLHKLCRSCTKQLAKFFDDNRSAIISM